MGLTSAFVKLVSAWFAFFLPAYGTYKALKGRPLTEKEVERLAQYWAVLGVFTSIEYVSEWVISWIPFYFEIKILFLLFLSLPQIQGSSFIYNSYLQPFFEKNEVGLDKHIDSAKNNTVAWLQTHLQTVFNLVFGLINKNSKPAPGQPQSGLDIGAVLGLFGQLTGSKQNPSAAASTSTTRGPTTPPSNNQVPLTE